jgi:hypothetical protein
MVMLGRAVLWLRYSVRPKTSFSRVGHRQPTGGPVALESRREDSWTVFGGTVGARITGRHAMPSA